ncbi:MAG TPA: hypothetical protein VJ697_14745 [Nitrososphaeraceae archaeon]|nr:hypothetical protein [Nitrososphaeraceae archaeon]
MRRNTANNPSCSYGPYAYTIGMTQSIREKNCKNIATRVFQNYPYCEKHYQLVDK